MTRNPTVWVLCDDRAGNVSQALGVGEALNWAFERKDIHYGPFAKLPNSLVGATLRGMDRKTRQTIKPPWPDLVISAGRRTAPIARYIKKASKGGSKLVHLMDPGRMGENDFDAIFVPEHDQLAPKDNRHNIVGAPHRVSSEKLDQARADWQAKFEELPRPLIALIIGGATKSKEFSQAMAQDLGQQMNQLAEQEAGSLLITTSRRTGERGGDILSQISVPHHLYGWGDTGDNPYFGYLACADKIVVTGDSISMCCEACASGKPVAIFAPEGMVSDKHQRFVDSLLKGGYATKLEDGFKASVEQSLNAADDIAKKIKELF